MAVTNSVQSSYSFRFPSD